MFAGSNKINWEETRLMTTDQWDPSLYRRVQLRTGELVFVPVQVSRIADLLIRDCRSPEEAANEIRRLLSAS